ncbi:hypothetical protein [Hymenobacter convexus]|uniref:hypothetical protein n=1 Tax=Hymenobacter sp. CA1UV-4 TaxID=3063782 RepID=UPI0027139AA3|nr:hypothetical protein [Hymenobacter sp. CA1UV-4]MDO7853935.1 hypothetical protein [Hymenobacter sp. CA1UV-4]
MADINIQRKKASPSPWLLVLLAAVVLAVAAYFFLRPDPADEPAPPAAIPAATAPAPAPDTLAAANAVDQATRRAAIDGIPQGDSTTAGSSETAATLAAQAATDPAAPDYALNGLQKLTGVLVALTDRDDLRDASTTEQRDNLTSATARLGEPNASLRPGFVAAAGLIRALQQKAYPDLEGSATELVNLAGQLSGRSATAAEQQKNKQFLTQAAAAVRVLSEPKN